MSKWFKPAKGQFQIYYKWGADHPEYQPDLIAETGDIIYMMEPKARGEMEDPQVLAKRDVAVTWRTHASHHAAGHGGKPWKYLLIPHNAISEIDVGEPGSAIHSDADGLRIEVLGH